MKLKEFIVSELDIGSLSIRMLVSDFDGVFTDNKVYVDSTGNEMVCCSRSDSLGIEYFRRSREQGHLNFNFIVLSTERNAVVRARCSKLQLDCHSGVADKANFLKQNFGKYLNRNGVLEGFLFLGNDLNDLAAINLCEFSAAPKDSHPTILENVDFVSQYYGGNGFVREIIEKLVRFP